MDIDTSDVVDLTPTKSESLSELPTVFTDTGDRFLNSPRYFAFQIIQTASTA